ncbi:MAG: LPXTG cell wall anchor domain-containing protein [Lachnospiraceae bacterium]|nr:LPXTG cell wall anchor domain-containing protein [Lachnospiraceae bacterium]
MKKFFKAGFALVLAGLLMAPHCEKAFAAEQGTLYAADAEADNLSDAGEKTDHAMYDERHGYVSLKSDSIGSIIFTIDAETAGKYEIGVVYAAKEGSAARKLGLSVNGAAASLVNLTCAGDWDTFLTYTVTADLSAGKNTVAVSTPSDFNNDTVKTPNVYALTYALKEAAPAADAGDSAPAQPQLPKTGLTNSIYFYIIGAVVVFAGAAVLLKKQKEA